MAIMHAGAAGRTMANRPLDPVFDAFGCLSARLGAEPLVQAAEVGELLDSGAEKLRRSAAQ